MHEVPSLNGIAVDNHLNRARAGHRLGEKIKISVGNTIHTNIAVKARLGSKVIHVDKDIVHQLAVSPRKGIIRITGRKVTPRDIVPAITHVRIPISERIGTNNIVDAQGLHPVHEVFLLVRSTFDIHIEKNLRKRMGECHRHVTGARRTVIYRSCQAEVHLLSHIRILRECTSRKKA